MRFARLIRSSCILALLAIVALTGCQRSPEARSAEYIRAGKRFMQNRDIARAVLQFRSAAQVMPKNSEAYYQLALAYLAGKNFSEGVTFLRKTLEVNPKHTGAQLRMTQLMVEAGDETLSDAGQRMADLLLADPSNPEVLQAYALTELKMGKVEEALAHLEQAISSAPQEIILAGIAAQAMVQKNDLKGAEGILRKACENNPKSADAKVILGRLYLSQGKATEAEKEFATAREMSSKHVGALANLAVLQRSQGRKQEAEQNFKRISSIADNRFNYFYAVFLFEEGRRDEAVRELERLARQDPDDRDARTRLVAAYHDANRLPDAYRVLDEALKRNPRDLDVALQRGELLLESGKFADAEMELNRVVHLKPDSAEAHFVLSKLHQARGTTHVQRQELEEALRLNPSLLQVRIELARALTRDGMSKRALDLLDALPTNQKNLPVVLEERNWALLGVGDSAAARKSIDEGLHAGKSPNLLLQDGLLKMSQKDMAGARGAAEQVLRENPGDSRALMMLAGSYIAQDQLPMAVQKVREHAAQATKFPAVQYYFGQLLVLSGNREEARGAFNAARAADPNYFDADVAMAQLDANDGKVDESKKRLNAVLAKNGNVLAARLLLAQIDVQARNFTAAADFYRQMATDFPGNLVVLNNLAYSLVETGRYDEGLKYAQEAKELAPDRPDIDDTLGWAMYKKGIYQTAVQYLERAVAKDNSPIPKYHLAMAHLKAGNEMKGRELLRATLKTAPGLPEAQMAQTVLAEAGKAGVKK